LSTPPLHPREEEAVGHDLGRPGMAQQGPDPPFGAPGLASMRSDSGPSTFTTVVLPAQTGLKCASQLAFTSRAPFVNLFQIQNGSEFRSDTQHAQRQDSDHHRRRIGLRAGSRGVCGPRASASAPNLTWKAQGEFAAEVGGLRETTWANAPRAFGRPCPETADSPNRARA